MTPRSLAVKNVRHQLRQYAAFFLSSAFAVWLFYLYGALLLHPDFQAGKVPDLVRLTLVGVEVVVVIFSVLFIVHAHSAFLKARQRELGLLTLLGMGPGQLARMLYAENALVGLGATTAGVALGIVCSRLFFLGIGRVLALDRPYAFHVSPAAILLTCLAFSAIFGLISLIGHLKLRRAAVAELIRGSRAPQAPPRASAWLAGLGVLCLGLAYGFGLTTGQEVLRDWLMPFILALLLGTYLLFSQAGVAALSLLRRLRPFYWRRTNLFILSQMAYRLKGNVRVLFMVAIMSSLAMTAAGINYSGLSMARESAAEWHPVSISLEGEPTGVGPERVRAVLAQHGLTVAGAASVPVLWAELRPEGGERLLVTSGAAVNRWRTEVLRRPPIEIEPGKAVAAVSDVVLPPVEGQASLKFGDQVVTLPLSKRLQTLEFNLIGVIVVDDAAFADLQARFGETHGFDMHGFALDDWLSSEPAYAQLQREIGPDARSLVRPPGPLFGGRLSGTYEFYASQKRMNALGLFITSFVGLLFLLAAGNMLYFKLFHDLNEDRIHFAALCKLGLGVREVRRIVSVQTFVLFFAPLIVGAAHVTLLQTIAGDLLHIDVWKPVAVVILAYGLLQAGYYLITSRTYVRALLGDS